MNNKTRSEIIDISKKIYDIRERIWPIMACEYALYNDAPECMKKSFVNIRYNAEILDCVQNELQNVINKLNYLYSSHD